MNKRPRTDPSNNQEDIWGDDFTYDEVNTIDNITTLASQSHPPGEYRYYIILVERIEFKNVSKSYY